MANKTQVLQLRLTEDEKELIQQQAEKVGLSMARYLVMLAKKDAQLLENFRATQV